MKESVIFQFKIDKLMTFLIIFLIAGAGTAIPILASGFNPFEVYYSLLYGGFGSLGSITRTLNKTVPILFCSVGIIIAFRCGVWNIGAEGQLFMGALAATVVGLFVKGISGPLHLFFVVLAGFIGGGIWGGIAGFMKVKYSANEIIVTLLMNFIAFWIIYYMVRFPLRPETAFNPVTAPIAETARLPILVRETSLHLGILIALVFSFVIWFVLQRTVLGYRIRLIGSNPEAALYGGLSINRIIMLSMFLSGGIAGLAGMSEVAGIQYLLSERISFSYGYLAIPAALLARLNPLGAILSSLFLGGLLTGARFVQAALGVPSTVVFVLMGVFVLAMLLESTIENLLFRLFS
jgi:simple sugar transport system permease protein